MNKLQKFILLIATVLGLSLPCGAPCQPLRAMNEISPARFKISRQDLEHGERQVQSLIRDRPRMAKYVAPGDPVWKWLVEQFAGEGIGRRIHWENSIPQNGAVAESHPPAYGIRAAIRVRDTDNKLPLGGEVQCLAAIYELINIRNGPEFEKTCRAFLDTKSSKNKLQTKIARNKFVERTTMLEYNALVSLRSLYYLVWLPSMKSKNIRSEEHSWRTNISQPYSAWIKTKDAAQYVNYWGKSFDDWPSRD